MIKSTERNEGIRYMRTIRVAVVIPFGTLVSVKSDRKERSEPLLFLVRDRKERSIKRNDKCQFSIYYAHNQRYIPVFIRFSMALDLNQKKKMTSYILKV